MKAVMLLVLVVLSACASVSPRPPVVQPPEQYATDELIQQTLHDDVRTFGIVWNKGRSQLIVTETAIGYIPADDPNIPLLQEDADRLRAYLKEHRKELLGASDFLENPIPECADGFVRLVMNDIGKTVNIAGCASISLEYKGLFEILRELENRYFP